MPFVSLSDFDLFPFAALLPTRLPIFRIAAVQVVSDGWPAVGAVLVER